MKIKEKFMMKGYRIGFILGMLCIGGMNAVPQVGHLSGWYQRSPVKLREQLAEIDKKAQQKYNADIKNIRACIVPHAGLKYSGSVAASCFRLVDPKKINRIIILAPSHRIPFKRIALPVYDSYSLPNGTLKVDKKAIKALQKSKLFQAQKTVFKDPHKSEHSLEIELPLIKHYFGETPIVPLIVGHVSEDDREGIVKKLRSIIDDSTLVVASSDFTHYGPRFDYEPFKGQDHLQDRIKQLDGSILEKIFSLSSQKFLSRVHEKEATVCGKYPVALLLELIQKKVIKNVDPYLVSYATSHAYDNSDPLHSVSYAGGVFAEKKSADLPSLTQYEKTELLKLARTTLEQHFTPTKEVELFNPIKTNTLKEPYGAFVTLHDNNKKLRGCIGSITTTEPLHKTIMQRAKSAAVYDTRFKPLTKKELSSTHIKISVLSKPKVVSSYKKIVLGRDGIILNHVRKTSVYLPAVAREQKWDLKQTLESLSKKAGLPASAWKDKQAKFKTFQSVDFEE